MTAVVMKCRVGCPACGWSGYRRDRITAGKLGEPHSIASRRGCPRCGGQVCLRYVLIPKAEDAGEGGG